MKYSNLVKLLFVLSPLCINAQVNTDANGNVGVGTTTVENSELWSKVFEVHGLYHSKILTSSNVNNVYAGLWSHSGGFFGANNTGSGFSGTWSNHPFHLMTNKQVRFTVATNGFVGVGTQNPLEAFQVGEKITFHDGGWKGIMYNQSWNNSLNVFTRIATGAASGIFFQDVGNIIFQVVPPGNAGASATNAPHALIIHNSGQVGVGTGASTVSFPDQTFKLFVEGGVRARKIKIDQQNWPDYVFEPSYRLRPLSELETFVTRNKHLPGIPSAAEVEQNGLDVGENQAALLKKIEELTLYIIEQNKKLERLTEEVNTLKEKLEPSKSK